ncbi:hypothetical protein KIH74_31335 [Kineosporia sp. J2-2]|uniref:Pimeloyl-ACP methyl ester carboxylesterase n=1 Tax=Kineosporia corallincola TaxID=2835133 RepID=A0ABS5TRQ3_9ACTN|nr:alpha/beta hydrolase [Kineosporia corallincola]MBT0773482.1 hypothetical protein [Kineosporia corallincola]
MSAADDVEAGVTEAVLDVAPLLRALETPQRVHLPDQDGLRAQAVLDAAARALALPAPVVTPSAEGHTAAELIIGRRLHRSDPGSADPGTTARAAESSRRRPFLVKSSDGSVLNCYTAGPEQASAVVLVTACGMPAGLLDRWIGHLSREHRVVTWESRALFPDPDNRWDDEGFDERGQDLAAQADDVVSVLAALALEDAHVVGLCGGAAVALLAAGLSPRIGSLSLWHGDYELGPDAAKTTHQHDMQTLLVQAGRSRERARGLHRVFRRPSTLAALRDDLAHHLYYPYATAELLYRYGRLNGAIMTTDCRPFLAGVTQPTLVVTSPEDTTAHPDGSRHVAAALPDGWLTEMPHGDHLAAFDASDELLDVATDFIGEVHR